jgi:hypothetical protein
VSEKNGYGECLLGAGRIAKQTISAATPAIVMRCVKLVNAIWESSMALLCAEKLEWGLWVAAMVL